MLVERTEPVRRLQDRQVRDLADAELADLDRERLGLEALAVTDLALGRVLEAAELLLKPSAVGIFPAPLHVGQHALEWPLRRVGAQTVIVAHRNVVAARAEQDRVADLLRQVLPGLVG